LAWDGLKIWIFLSRGLNWRLLLDIISDLEHFDADPDTAFAYNFDADPDADPDPTFHFDPDADPCESGSESITLVLSFEVLHVQFLEPIKSIL
jgi:hypothetical protein